MFKSYNNIKKVIYLIKIIYNKIKLLKKDIYTVTNKKDIAYQVH